MIADGAPWPRMVVGDVTVDLVQREHALSLMMDSASTTHPLAVVSANLHHIHLFADGNPWPETEPRAHGITWLTLLDGVPLVQSANALTGQRWPKLAGSDLIEPILEDATARGLRVGFLGGESAAHRVLRTVLAERFPGLCVSGMWAPARAEITNESAAEHIANEIREAGVDVLFVGLGKPRQEWWIARFGHITDARLLLAFGAAADFLTGQQRRAPRLVADSGGEWAWRLMLEPRRLARRYLVECPPALVRLKRTAVVRESFPNWDPPDGGGGHFVAVGRHAAVAVITVTYNSAAHVGPLVEDLRSAARDRPIRLVVVDNASTDHTVRVVAAHDDIVLVQPGTNLGYAGGINAGLARTGPCDHVLVLNPDLRLAPDALTHLLAAADGDRVGAVVPLIVDDDGVKYPSLRREPSVIRAFFDALLGGKVRTRPPWSSEIDTRPASYGYAHDVDWATGAALVIPAAVGAEVGPWNEEFFLYSEETDYFRRIRKSGRRIRFEPAAVVAHRGAGSGTSPDLYALSAVNRVRYAERHGGRVHAVLFRSVVAFAEALRSYQPTHRRALCLVLNRRRWHELPHAAKEAQPLSGRRNRGAIIVPAFNEAAVIKRTLEPLSRAAVEQYFELIVVCNGCVDTTADIARAIPGVRVLELTEGSKPAALNAGDIAASLWPRVYLDADIQISASAVLAILDRLERGDVLIARPEFETDTRRADALVRSYYRVRGQLGQHRSAMWGAGTFGLTETGHARFGVFPSVTSEDRFVDTRFDPEEKAVVATEPAIVTTPLDIATLVRVLGRTYKGSAELLAHETGPDKRDSERGVGTMVSVFGTIRGPRSAFDAAVYLGVAIAARMRYRTASSWERDDSSRTS